MTKDSLPPTYADYRVKYREHYDRASAVNITPDAFNAYCIQAEILGGRFGHDAGLVLDTLICLAEERFKNPEAD